METQLSQRRRHPAAGPARGLYRLGTQLAIIFTLLSPACLAVTTAAGQGRSEASPATRPAFKVDRFGQNAALTWPGKLLEESELAKDVAGEAAFYAGLAKQPPLDPYGGLLGSKEKLGLAGTGFFRVQKVNGTWYLVDPLGNAFFQMGLCVFTPASDTYIEGRENHYEWLPPRDGPMASAWRPEPGWNKTAVSFYRANFVRKYGVTATPDAVIEKMVPRVRAMGFNASGAFSGVHTQVQKKANFPYMKQLGRPANEIPGLRETFDPFDPQVRQTIADKYAAGSLKTDRDNPLVIGYYLNNEPAYDDVARVVPKLDGAKWAAKRELVRQLRETYPDVGAFNAAWKTEFQSLDELSAAALVAKTDAAAKDIATFTARFFETWYELVATEFRKHDPNHLLMGSRLTPTAANQEAVARAAGKWCDVYSVNYYSYTINRSFLDRIHAWTGDKPMLFSEFYFNTPASGVPGGVKEVRTLADRGKRYRQYVEHAAATPYVIGIEWFTLIDAHMTGQWFGKYSGENHNSGLFNVVDRPWEDLVRAAAETNARVYAVKAGEAKPYTDTAPRHEQNQIATAARPAKKIAIDGGANDWPALPPNPIGADRLVHGPDAGQTSALFRACWDETYLYLYIDTTDPTPLKKTRKGASMWQCDGVELFIGPGGRDVVGQLRHDDKQLLMGAGEEGLEVWCVQAAKGLEGVQSAITPRPDRSGYAIEVALPWAGLGISPEPGQVLHFDLGIDDSETGGKRTRQLMWNGGPENSGDRTHWGSLRLAP